MYPEAIEAVSEAIPENGDNGMQKAALGQCTASPEKNASPGVLAKTDCAIEGQLRFGVRC